MSNQQLASAEETGTVTRRQARDLPVRGDRGPRAGSQPRDARAGLHALLRREELRSLRTYDLDPPVSSPPGRRTTNAVLHWCVANRTMPGYASLGSTPRSRSKRSCWRHAAKSLITSSSPWRQQAGGQRRRTVPE